MNLLQIALSTSLVTGLSACASTTAVRSLAQQNGAFVQSLSTGTAEFLTVQNALNAQGEVRLQQLDADATATGADARQLRLAWSDSGEAIRYQSLDRATTVSADAIMASMQARSPAPIVVQPVIGGYDASIQALAQASEKPKPIDQLGELVAFAKTVGTTLNDLQDKAKAAAAAAASTAAAKDAAGQKATGDAVKQ